MWIEKEIEDIQLLDGHSEMNLKLIKTGNLKLQWIPEPYVFPMEVEITELVAEAIREECENLWGIRVIGQRTENIK